MTSSIGIMDGAFFVGRKEIVDWVNTTLQLNIVRIEDTASGAVACQLLDVMHHGAVPMHKVNWAAKQDFQFVANYKILQTCFNELRIEKHVEVDRLITGRYMDNLEFMQWFKRFFEMGVQDVGQYDAIGQRAKGKGGPQYFPKGAARQTGSSTAKALLKPRTAAPASGGGAATASTRHATSAPTRQTSNNKPPPTATTSKLAATASSSVVAQKRVVSAAPAGPGPAAVSSAGTSSAEDIARAAVLQAALDRASTDNEDLHLKLSEVRLEMDGMEKERDFYFDKLRDIEILLQDLEDNGAGTTLTASILKILYATKDGFDTTLEEGNAEAELEQEQGDEEEEQQHVADDQDVEPQVLFEDDPNNNYCEVVDDVDNAAQDDSHVEQDNDEEVTY